MVRVARTWFRDTNTAVAITVGVVGGWVVYSTISVLAQSIVYPSLFEPVFDNGDQTTSIGFIDIYYPQLVIQAISLLMMAAVIYTLFIWPGGEPTEEDANTAECPECKSEIWADATRCAYCTSIVTPRPESSDGA